MTGRKPKALSALPPPPTDEPQVVHIDLEAEKQRLVDLHHENYREQLRLEGALRTLDELLALANPSTPNTGENAEGEN